jgi:hypothetical protein
MMNGAAISMVSKKHLEHPSTCNAELKTAFDTSTDTLELRNLLSQLEDHQIKPTAGEDHN